MSVKMHFLCSYNTFLTIVGTTAKNRERDHTKTFARWKNGTKDIGT